MDFLFLGSAALLWALMVLLVAGLRKLDPQQKGRP